MKRRTQEGSNTHLNPPTPTEMARNWEKALDIPLLHLPLFRQDDRGNCLGQRDRERGSTLRRHTFRRIIDATRRYLRKMQALRDQPEEPQQQQQHRPATTTQRLRLALAT